VKLYAEDGSQYTDPVARPASVSWRATDGVAQAFGPDNRLLAELHCARVEWIEAGGIRIVGTEAIDSTLTRFRAQAWHYKP
jgi:hypothetical protein